MKRFGLVALALVTLALSSAAPRASARCAFFETPEDAQRATFVVEAVLERAGATAHFRTVTVWKGGDAAPALFTLAARQGRGQWPWALAANVGHRYMLFLTQDGDRYFVARCGQSGEATDALRDQLRALSLSPRQR